jgi:hypothetical protein
MRKYWESPEYTGERGSNSSEDLRQRAVRHFPPSFRALPNPAILPRGGEGRRRGISAASPVPLAVDSGRPPGAWASGEVTPVPVVL